MDGGAQTHPRTSLELVPHAAAVRDGVSADRALAAGVLRCSLRLPPPLQLLHLPELGEGLGLGAERRVVRLRQPQHEGAGVQGLDGGVPLRHR